MSDKIPQLNTEDLETLEVLAVASTPLTLEFGRWDTESIDQAVNWFQGSLEKGEGYRPWVVHTEHAELGPLTICITGNGPTSEANARFFTVARMGVLALLQYVETLRAAHAVAVDEMSRHASAAGRLAGENEGLRAQLATRFAALDQIADMAKEGMDVCDPRSPHAARYDAIHCAAVAVLGEA